MHTRSNATANSSGDTNIASLNLAPEVAASTESTKKRKMVSFGLSPAIRGIRLYDAVWDILEKICPEERVSLRGVIAFVVVFARVYVCMTFEYLHVYMYIYIHIYIYIYIYIHELDIYIYIYICIVPLSSTHMYISAHIYACRQTCFELILDGSSKIVSNDA